MNIFVYLCNPDRKIEGKVLANSYGVIAQLVEQRTENPCVPGSIPGDTTLKIRELQKRDSLFLCCFGPRFKAGQAMGDHQ